MSVPVVAIDGAAGSGKSTLSRALAAALGLPYVNTGLMYRAVAAAALEAGVDPEDPVGLENLIHSLRFDLAGSPPELHVEGWPVAALTTADVERSVSAVARHPSVRTALRAIQRSLGARGAVMEGRDIGSVVFPDATLKIFLVAGPGTRIARRAAERAQNPGAIARSVAERDAKDAATNPLEPGPDAIVLQTDALGIEATLEAALAVVRDRAPELLP